MLIFYSASSETLVGPTVEINCPVCHAYSVEAESVEQTDYLKLFFFIPIFRLRNTFLTCTACRKQLMTKLSIDQIADYPVEDLSSQLAGRTSFIGKFLAIASVVLFWALFIGLVLGVISLLVNRHSTGWARTVGWVGTVLSAAFTLFLLVLILLSN